MGWLLYSLAIEKTNEKDPPIKNFGEIQIKNYLVDFRIIDIEMADWSVK